MLKKLMRCSLVAVFAVLVVGALCFIGLPKTTTVAKAEPGATTPIVENSFADKYAMSTGDTVGNLITKLEHNEVAYETTPFYTKADGYTGNITFTIKDSNDSTADPLSSADSLSARTYYVFASFQAQEGFDNSYVSYPINVKYTLTNVNVEQDGTLTYTGEEQTALVTTSATPVGEVGVTFKYSTAVDGEYSPSIPGFTTAGNHTVYYIASANDHVDAKGSFTITINQKEVGLTWSTLTAEELVYSGTAKTLSATATDLVNEDTCTVIVELTTPNTNVNVGSFTYTATGLSNDNYKLPDNVTSDAYTITKAQLTVTADDKAITYGDSAPVYTYTITGYVNSETIEVVDGTATLTCNYNITSAATRGAGSYPITFDAQGLTADNYTFNYVPGTLTVNKRLIYLGVHSGTSVYGSEISGFIANYTGDADHRPIYDDGVSAFGQTNAIFTLSCSVSTTSPVGSYNIIPALAEGYTANYVLDVNVENGTYTITPATITNITCEQSGTLTYTGVAQTANVTASATTVNDTEYTFKYSLTNDGEFTTTIPTFTNAGDDYVVYYKVTAQNHNDSEVASFTVTIAPATLTVTANKTITYGDFAPASNAYIITYSGFVNGQNENTVTITGSPVVSCASYDVSDADKRGVGDYTTSVDVTGLSTGNYTFVASEGTLTVDQKEVGLTWSTLTADQLVYSGTAKTLSATATGLVNEDTCTVTVALTAPNTNVNVGSFTFAATDLSNDNYKLPANVTSDAYTITKAQLTVTADDKAITYGDSAPAYTYTITGYVNDETIAVVSGEATLTCTYDTASTENRGANTYPITFSAQGLTATNYTFNYVSGTLTVNKKDITVTVNSFEVIYGSSVPTYTFSIVGGQFVFTDSSSDFGGEATYTCDYAVTSNVGNYPITMSGFTSDNYNISYTNDAKVTVTQKEVGLNWSTLTAEELVYSGTAKTLSATATGLVNEDTCTVTVELTTPNTNVNVGSFTFAATGLSNDNYKLPDNVTSDAYTITKAQLTVTADDKAITYGDSAPAYTYTITGYVNDETIAVVSGEATLTCSYDTESAENRIVGSYPITFSAQGLTATNYTFNYVAGNLTVGARHITVEIANKNSVYGNNVAILTSKIKSGKPAYNEEDLYTLNCVVNNKSHVGNYAITGQLNNSNYAFTFTPGVYSVTPRVVTLKWSNFEFAYDGKPHAPTATAEGLVDGDQAMVIVEGAAVFAGEYTATAIRISNPNYALGDNTTHKFTILKPATFNKVIDEEIAATDGVNITDIFKNVDTTNEDVELEIKVGDTTIVFDRSALTALADAKDVKLVMSTKTGEDATESVKGAEMVFEISLLGATFENGQATITAEFENNAPVGKVAKVYYVDANGKLTNMHGEFKDGKVTFTTNHFSTYIVKYELSGGTIAGIVIACVLFTTIVLFVIAWFVLMKKSFKDLCEAVKGVFKKDEEKVEDKNEEVKEEKVEISKKEVKKDVKLKHETAPIKKTTKTASKSTAKKTNSSAKKTTKNN